MKGHKLQHRLSALLLCTAFISSCLGNAFSAVAEDVGDENTSPVPEGCVASIARGGDTQYYETLAAAIEAVQPGDTVDLWADITESVSSSDLSYTLDMHGHYISGEGEGRVYEISGGTVTLKNGTLTNGKLGKYENGAGLYIDGDANITLDGMTITENTAEKGGGIYFDGSGELNINNSTVSNNTATYMGGGLFATPDYDMVYDPSSWSYNFIAHELSVNLKNVKFNGNNTNSSSNSSAGSAMMLSRITEVTADGCDFIGNYGEGGIESSIITIEQGDDRIGVTGSNSFKNCKITQNHDCEYIVYITGFYGYDYNFTKILDFLAEVKFENCLISDNEAEITGGIHAYDHSKITLDKTVVRDNTATGKSVGDKFASGGISLDWKRTSLELISGAIYNNNSEQTEANDLYIHQNAEDNVHPNVTIIAPDTMKDNFAEDDTDFSSYLWLGDDDTTIEGAIVSTTDAPYSSANMLLTAYEYIDRHVVEYNGEGYDSIQAAVDAAADDPERSDPAEIKLIANKDGLGKIFSTEPVDVTIPVKLDLNGHIVNSYSIHDRKLFNISGDDGSLTLSGTGKLHGIIDIQNNNNLKAADDFAIGELSIALDGDSEDTLNNAELNTEDDFICVVLENGKNKVEPENIKLVNIKNPNVEVYVDGSDIMAVNHTLKDHIFVNGTSGNDNNNGAFGTPFKSLEEAIEKWKENKDEDCIIYIRDTVTVGGNCELDGEGAFITRYSRSGDIDGKNMINVTGSLTVENLTLDGGSDIYSNAGSIINVSSRGELTLGSGATLQNNDVSGTGSSITDRAGGGVYSTGTVNMDGGTITGCTALLGGGICAKSSNVVAVGGSSRSFVNMTDGSITGNKAIGHFFTDDDDHDHYEGSGGGVVLMDNSCTMTMSGGSISGNEANNGGGVCLGTMEYSIYTLTPTATNFTMTGGEFVGNESLGNGGGMYIQCSYAAVIEEGIFTENQCHGGVYGGGAIYVNGGRYVPATNSSRAVTYAAAPEKTRVPDGVLRLTNALITENEAQEQGGGIAGCDTSCVIIKGKNGSVIFQNTVNGKSNDVTVSTSSNSPGIFSGRKSETQDTDYIAMYMMDGTPYNWQCAQDNNVIYNYGDYVAEDYLSGDEGKCIFTSAVPSQDTIDDTRVKIINNISDTSGGGIGSNGAVYIGEDPGTAQGEFEVTKVWENYTNPDDSAEYPAQLDKLNIWVMFVNNENGEVRNFIHNKLMNGVAAPRNYRDSVSFESPDGDVTAVILEQVIFKDGRQVWATIDGEEPSDAIKAAIRDIIGDAEYIWSNDEYSPFSSDKSGGFTFINTMNTGDLKVSKTVDGNKGDKNKEFEFTVTLGDNTISGTYGDMKFENGVATFNLKDGESKTAEGLPSGITYLVEEKEMTADGYITKTTNAEGKIPVSTEEDPKTAEAEFTNIKNGDTISVKKIWVDDESADRPDSIFVQLYKDGEEEENAFGEPVELNEGNEWIHTWEYIWTEESESHVWFVKEVEVPEGYYASSEHTDNDWTITNKKYVSLTVNKVWEDDVTGEHEAVSAQLYKDGTPDGAPVELSEENDWTYTWNELERGHAWSVAEVNVPAGYHMTIGNDGDVWTITNIKDEEDSSSEIESSESEAEGSSEDESSESEAEGSSEVESSESEADSSSEVESSESEADSSSEAESSESEADSSSEVESSESEADSSSEAESSESEADDSSEDDSSDSGHASTGGDSDTDYKGEDDDSSGRGPGHGDNSGDITTNPDSDDDSDDDSSNSDDNDSRDQSDNSGSDDDNSNSTGSDSDSNSDSGSDSGSNGSGSGSGDSSDSSSGSSSGSGTGSGNSSRANATGSTNTTTANGASGANPNTGSEHSAGTCMILFTITAAIAVIRTKKRDN